MKKRKIYLDTSVINFVFAEDAPNFQRATIEFFQKVAPSYSLFISDVVIDEISRATDEKHRERLLRILTENDVQILANDSDDDVRELANVYLDKGIIPRAKVEDALHVAYAVIHEMDFLLSWNFRHLANVNKEEKILAANLEQGIRHPLRITSPLEVFHES